MPDVQVRITTTGAEQAVQSFGQVAQASQRFAQTTSSTVSQARVATMGFNIALLETARVARLAGPAGNEFATSLESAATVGFAARGAIGAYRSVVDGLPLILRTATAATEAFRVAMVALIGPWGLFAIAILAAATALAIYSDRVNSTKQAQVGINGATEDAIRLHHSLAEAIKTTSKEQERFAAALALERTPQERERGVIFQHILEQRIKAEHDAAEAAKAALELEMNDIAAFNVWQRQQWENAALLRQQKFIEDSDHAEAALQLEMDDIAAYNVWVRQQWENSAQIRQQKYIEEADKAIAEQKRIQAAVESAISGVLQVTTQGTDLWSQLWVIAANKAIEQIALVKAAAGFISGIVGGILGFFGLQHGGSFIATSPRLIAVGESGAERVSVTPLAGAPATTGGGATFVLSNVVMDEIGMEKFAKRVVRILTTGPVSRVG